ncbi:MAG: hypothetical protein JO056_07265 [Alphaproteobacteria bacterium]|nr:hypothetical protein [Alphaproteobacteria bacterium]
MTLSNLAALGSFVSGIAVLISLVFLYFQLRQINRQIKQAERNQRAFIRQARSTRTVDIVLSLTDASLSEAMGKGRHCAVDISDIALRQFAAYWRASFYSWEEGFYQHRDSLLDDAGFNALATNVKYNLGNIGVRTQWRLQRQSFGREFVTWIDDLTVTTPIEAAADTLIQWQHAIAAEREGVTYGAVGQ